MDAGRRLYVGGAGWKSRVRVSMSWRLSLIMLFSLYKFFNSLRRAILKVMLHGTIRNDEF